MLIAREFCKADEEKVFDMIKEINEFDGNFEGLNSVGKIENYDVFLIDVEKKKNQELIKPEYAPQTIFGIFKDEELIGGFTLRHALKGNLINHGGNIGYLVRPSKRKMGYGKKTLFLALEEAKNMGLEKVLVTCREENVGSEKVIIANNGVYENSYLEESTGVTYKRFWIEILK